LPGAAERLLAQVLRLLAVTGQGVRHGQHPAVVGLVELVEVGGAVRRLRPAPWSGHTVAYGGHEPLHPFPPHPVAPEPTRPAPARRKPPSPVRESALLGGDGRLQGPARPRGPSRPGYRATRFNMDESGDGRPSAAAAP